MTEVAAGRRNEHVILELDGSVAVVTMNRPERRNALSLAHMTELIDVFREIGARRDTGAVVLRGAGPAFCSGHDLGEMIDRELDDFRNLFEVCADLMGTIQGIPQPVIAEVHGIATAAGCQLVATCDLAIAAETARFATPGVNIGLFCSTPMVALTRAVGRKAAMEMLLTGKLIDAETAQAIGLVNRVVPRESLRDAVDDLRREISGKSVLVVKIGKKACYRQAELDLAAAYRYAAEVMTTNMLARDAGEGIDAVLRTRPAIWHDR